MVIPLDQTSRGCINAGLHPGSTKKPEVIISSNKKREIERVSGPLPRLRIQRQEDTEAFKKVMGEM